MVVLIYLLQLETILGRYDSMVRFLFEESHFVRGMVPYHRRLKKQGEVLMKSRVKSSQTRSKSKKKDTQKRT